jgi:hypothetical protein
LFFALQVVITLTDENDNPPMFDRKEYDVTIEDRISVEPPALITRVGANDPDVGFGGDLLYSIVSGNSDGAFQLDPKRGFVKPSGKIPIWNMPSKPDVVELKVRFQYLNVMTTRNNLEVSNILAINTQLSY